MLTKKKINKSAEKIKFQILKRFDNMSDYDNSDFEKSSKIIHFDNLTLEYQQDILEKVKLAKYELPIIISNVNHSTFLLLTSENFHYVEDKKYEKLSLSDFIGGYPDEDEFDNIEEKSELEGLAYQEVPTKVEGNIIPFLLHKKDGTELPIKLSSGKGLYALWNTFNVIELVGQKYSVSDYENK